MFLSVIVFCSNVRQSSNSPVIQKLFSVPNFFLLCACSFELHSSQPGIQKHFLFRRSSSEDICSLFRKNTEFDATFVLEVALKIIVLSLWERIVFPEKETKKKKFCFFLMQKKIVNFFCNVC